MTMTSRERVLAALRREEVDYVPCTPIFEMMGDNFRRGHRYNFPWGPSVWEEVEYGVLELGIDPVVRCSLGNFQPGMPGPDVSPRVWVEASSIHKVWSTPAGNLSASVKYNELWPHGLDIPLYSDHNIAHFEKPWLESEQDLACLTHILSPLDNITIEQWRFDFAESKRLADKHGLATFAEAGLGLTGAMHLCGSENLCFLVMEDPGLVSEYLQLEHGLNLQKLDILMDLGVDIVKRNGFYETCDFYSPEMLSRFLEKHLNREIEIVHQAGKVICYCVHTGIMPMLAYLRRLAFDCLMQVEVASQDADPVVISTSQKKAKSFWLGPSDTYELGGSPELVRQALRNVFQAFGKKGLMITPSPSLTPVTPWENFLALVEEWKKLR